MNNTNFIPEASQGSGSNISRGTERSLIFVNILVANRRKCNQVSEYKVKHITSAMLFLVVSCESLVAKLA